jgi:hypothetical protein
MRLLWEYACIRRRETTSNEDVACDDRGPVGAD